MLGKIKLKITESKLQISIFCVLLLVFLVFTIANPRTFLSYNIYYAFMSIIPFAAILSISLTPIVILGEMDLSFPSVMGFCAWVFSAVFNQSGNIYLALICSLATGLFAGFINSIFIVRIGVPSLIVTIGMQYLWRGLVMIACGGVGLSLVDTQGSVLYKVLVGRIGNIVPAQAVWAIVIAIIFALILNWHRFGIHLLCVGDDAVSSRMMGVNVEKVKTIAFMQMGLFAAFAGILATLEVLYFWPSTGEGYLMKSLAAVFIGGTSVFGGAGIVSSGISGFWTKFIFGVVIVVSLTIYALMGKKISFRKKLLGFIKK